MIPRNKMLTIRGSPLFQSWRQLVYLDCFEWIDNSINKNLVELNVLLLPKASF